MNLKNLCLAFLIFFSSQFHVLRASEALLLNAVKHDDVTDLQWIAKRNKIDLKEFRFQGLSLMHIAAGFKAVQTIQALKEIGMSVNIRNNKCQLSPLHLAYFLDQNEAIEALFALEADPFLTTVGTECAPYGLTPLALGDYYLQNKDAYDKAFWFNYFCIIENIF